MRKLATIAILSSCMFFATAQAAPHDTFTRIQVINQAEATIGPRNVSLTGANQSLLKQLDVPAHNTQNDALGISKVTLGIAGIAPSGDFDLQTIGQGGKPMTCHFHFDNAGVTLTQANPACQITDNTTQSFAGIPFEWHATVVVG